MGAAHRQGWEAGSEPHVSILVPFASLNAVHAERRSAPASPESVDIMLQAMTPHVEHCSKCVTFAGTGAVSSG